MLTWGAWVTAEWAFLIAVSVLAFDVGGPAAVGVVGAVRVLPAAVLGGAVAMVSDRLPRPLVLAAVHASWCVVALAMTWLAAVDAPMLVLVVVVGLGSATSAVFKPCVSALIPQMVDNPRHLIVSNSAYSTVEAGGTVLGPVACGALLAVTGPPGVFLALAVIFAVGAAAAATMRTPFQPSRRTTTTRRRALTESLRGVRILTAPGISTAFALFMLQTMMRGLLNVFVIVLAATRFGGGDALAGSLFAAIGIGGLLGSVAALSGGGTQRSAGLLTIGIAMWGLPVAVIGLLLDPTVAWWALAALGLGNALLDIYGFSLLNRLIPDHVAGRAWGAFHSTAAAMVALGSLTAPLLISAAGLSWAMVISGTALTLAALVGWPKFRALTAGLEGDPAAVELLRQVPLFAPLSAIAVERLARTTREVHVSPGVEVVRQGEIGDLYFVVAEGDLSVRQDGREIRRLGATDSFGEIALLQAVPRTATVVSDGDSRLLSLDAESFVAAVTGHRDSERVAHGAVTELLADDARQRRAQDDDPQGSVQS